MRARAPPPPLCTHTRSLARPVLYAHTHSLTRPFTLRLPLPLLPVAASHLGQHILDLVRDSDLEETSALLTAFGGGTEAPLRDAVASVAAHAEDALSEHGDGSTEGSSASAALASRPGSRCVVAPSSTVYPAPWSHPAGPVGAEVEAALQREASSDGDMLHIPATGAVAPSFSSPVLRPAVLAPPVLGLRTAAAGSAGQAGGVDGVQSEADAASTGRTGAHAPLPPSHGRPAGRVSGAQGDGASTGTGRGGSLMLPAADHAVPTHRVLNRRRGQTLAATPAAGEPGPPAQLYPRTRHGAATQARRRHSSGTGAFGPELGGRVGSVDDLRSHGAYDRAAETRPTSSHGFGAGAARALLDALAAGSDGSGQETGAAASSLGSLQPGVGARGSISPGSRAHSVHAEWDGAFAQRGADGRGRAAVAHASLDVDVTEVDEAGSRGPAPAHSVWTEPVHSTPGTPHREGGRAGDGDRKGGLAAQGDLAVATAPPSLFRCLSTALRATDEDGNTALHIAAAQGAADLAAALLQHGADPAARDAEGQTPEEVRPRVTEHMSRSRLTPRTRRSPRGQGRPWCSKCSAPPPPTPTGKTAR